jgi:hypothetical protein
MAQRFNLNLLAQALQPMPYAPIGDQLILLTAIQHAEARADGGLTLRLVSGIDLPLTPEEASELEQILKAGIEHAQAAAARQAAQNLGLIQVPGMAH